MEVLQEVAKENQLELTRLQAEDWTVERLDELATMKKSPHPTIKWSLVVVVPRHYVAVVCFVEGGILLLDSKAKGPPIALGQTSFQSTLSAADAEAVYFLSPVSINVYHKLVDHI